jgi:hypothetical protein
VIVLLLVLPTLLEARLEQYVQDHQHQLLPLQLLLLPLLLLLLLLCG